MPDDTPATRAPDLTEQLQSFNAARAELLRGKPIDPDGERELGRLLSDEEGE